VEKKISKSSLARTLGISRGSLYYVSRQNIKDNTLKERIIETLEEHPVYGHKRIAIHLDIGKNRALRVMTLFGIKPKIRRRVPKYGARTSLSGIPNRTKGISPIAPNVIWSGDFTYLHFHGNILYLATVIDRFTREVIAWQIGLHHTTRLILDVLEEALRKRGYQPYIFHSDQGSEYTSNACIEWLTKHKILPSHSPKGKPWNNGHQESFFDKFKLEFGKPSRHENIENLIEAIGKYIHYYNTRRIHSTLKMPPRKFFEKEIEKLKPKENLEN
jgi:transposase InsO family protein